jgi:hypothetical protein
MSYHLFNHILDWVTRDWAIGNCGINWRPVAQSSWGKQQKEACSLLKNILTIKTWPQKLWSGFSGFRIAMIKETRNFLWNSLKLDWTLWTRCRIVLGPPSGILVAYACLLQHLHVACGWPTLASLPRGMSATALLLSSPTPAKSHKTEG